MASRPTSDSSRLLARDRPEAVAQAHRPQWRPLRLAVAHTQPLTLARAAAGRHHGTRRVFLLLLRVKTRQHLTATLPSWGKAPAWLPSHGPREPPPSPPLRLRPRDTVIQSPSGRLFLGPHTPGVNRPSVLAAPSQHKMTKQSHGLKQDALSGTVGAGVHPELGPGSAPVRAPLPST